MTSESSMSFFLYSREKAIILPSSLKNGYSLSPLNGDHNTLFSFLVGLTLPPNVVLTFFQNFAQNESSSVTYQYSAASCSESQARTIFLFWYLILLDLNTAFTASSSFFSSSSVGVQCCRPVRLRHRPYCTSYLHHCKPYLLLQLFHKPSSFRQA